MKTATGVAEAVRGQGNRFPLIRLAASEKFSGRVHISWCGSEWVSSLVKPPGLLVSANAFESGRVPIGRVGVFTSTASRLPFRTSKTNTTQYNTAERSRPEGCTMSANGCLHQPNDLLEWPLLTRCHRRELLEDRISITMVVMKYRNMMAICFLRNIQN